MGNNDATANARRPITRGEVARRLGVTATTVRRLEGTVLHPAIGEGGVRVFSAQEVERVVHERAAPPSPSASGEVAAEAFRMFRAGYDFDELVMRLKQSPETVRRLFKEWCHGL